jgi:hypothetical protein
VERIRPATRGGSDSGSAPRPAPASSGSSLSSKVLVVVLIVVGIALLAGMSLWFFRGSNSAVKGDQYQAVFLTNGQVYFGKLSNPNNKYVELKDIYYLQVTQQEIQEGSNDASADPQISLAKLGNELHGPEDSMYISRDQVLFWENLKGDGDVVTAITNFQNEGANE